MRKGRPTIDEIKEQFTKCKKVYSATQENFLDDEKFYELEFKGDLNIPDEFAADAVVVPTGRDMVDTFVDHIDIANARVFVNKKGISDISKESAEMLRKFYLGIIHRTNVESAISPWRVAAKHYAAHGLGVLKTVWDADRWFDKPSQEKGESEEDYAARLDEWRAQSHVSIPIVIQAVNPSCIMPDPYSGGSLYVFEWHKRQCFDIRLVYPQWSNPLGKKDDEGVESISFWTPHYRCELIDGEPVLKIRGGIAKHNYGFIPYTLIESGLGNLSKDAKPEKRYVGILRYMEDVLISESTNYSLNDILMKRETMKGGYITGADAGTMGDISQKYGEYTIVGDKDVEFHDWEIKLAPDASQAHLALTRDYISAHAAPRAVRGLSEPNIRSGAQERYRVAQGTTKYMYAVEAFKHGAENVLIKCAQLMKNVIPGDVELWARTPTDEFDVVIKKEQMREPFTCYVEFAPISEEDEYRRQDSLNKLWNGGNGLVTKGWARKQMSNIDPIAMEREDEKERLRMMPAYNQLKDQTMAMMLQSALQAEGLAPMPPSPEGTPLSPEQSPQGAGRRLVPGIPQRAPLGSMANLESQWKQQGAPTSGIQGTQGVGGGGQRG